MVIVIIENLSPIFHNLYRELCKEKLYYGEVVLFASDCTVNSGYDHSEGGFIVLTNRRYLLWFVSYLGGIIYFGDEPRSWLSTALFGDNGPRRRWIDNYKGVAIDSPLRKVLDDEYTKLRGIVRNDYEVSLTSGNVKLIELLFDYKATRSSWYVVFKETDGETVSQLLNTALQNQGVIS